MDSVDYTFRFREKYLADQLNPEDKKAFEEELGRNPQLLEALKEQIYLSNMLGEYLGEAGEKPSAETDNSPKEKQEGKLPQGGVRRLFDEPMKMVAVLAFFAICGLAVWWLMPGDQRIGEELYAENYTHLSQRETIGTKKGVNDTVEKFNGLDSLLYVALIKYSADDYPKAIDHLTTFINTGRDSLHKGVFYRAMASLKVYDTDAAIKDLQNYLGSSNSPQYKSDATWYLGLSYLKEEKLADARIQFNKLFQEDGPYKIRSQKIIERLSNRKSN